MTFLEEHSTIIGMLSLAFVIIFLFSTPSMLLAKEITIVDSALVTSENAIQVRTKMDFGNKEKVLNTMKDFTSEIFPLMFECREEQVIVKHLLNSGFLGWIIIVLLFFFPILITFYPRMKNKNAWVKK